MAVAKSYADCPIKAGPFEKDGKQYVTVLKTLKSGVQKLADVRWYPEANEPTLGFNPQVAFGFGDAGYITIFYGDEAAIKEWRQQLPRWTIWENTFFGYFMPSANHVDSVPAGVQSVKVYWKDICEADGKRMKPNDDVAHYVHSLCYAADASEYQGVINEWLERSVTITDKTERANPFGIDYWYTMRDDHKNIYIWHTSSRDLEVGRAMNLRMKVKNHEEHKGQKQTIVYYCKEK